MLYFHNFQNHFAVSIAQKPIDIKFPQREDTSLKNTLSFALNQA